MSFAAALIALGVGIPMGVYTALRRGSVPSQALMTLSLLGVSLPTFLIGILLIQAVLGHAQMAAQLRPRRRRHDRRVDVRRADARRAAPPDPAFDPLALFQLALIMRLVRSDAFEVLRSDYIRFARARGLPDRLVYFRHALKNTLVPVMTITGLQLGSLIAFAIITEQVFNGRAWGLLFIQAVTFADIPVAWRRTCA